MATLSHTFTNAGEEHDARKRQKVLDSLKGAMEAKGVKNIPNERDNYICPITGLTACITRNQGIESITIEVTESN